MCKVLLETHTDNDRNEDAIIEKQKNNIEKRLRR